MAERMGTAVALLAGAGATLAMTLLSGAAAHDDRAKDEPNVTTHGADAADAATDRQQILDHIDSIFRAYQEKDLATIRSTHSGDWRGFLSGSQRMLRGIDEYMAVAEQSVQGSIEGLGYQLLDVDVSVHGDVAIVFYLATYSIRRTDGDRHTPLRSVDIYERRDGEWIQTGSNICAPPQYVVSSAARVRPLGDAERAALLTAREAVWRAWFAGDEDALRGMLPTETIAINPGAGDWQDAARIIAGAKGFAASGATLAGLEFPRTEIQAYGPVAIIYTEYALRIRDGAGAESASSGRATEIFVFRDGRWLNSGWHLDQAAPAEQ